MHILHIPLKIRKSRVLVQVKMYTCNRGCVFIKPFLVNIKWQTFPAVYIMHLYSINANPCHLHFLLAAIIPQKKVNLMRIGKRKIFQEMILCSRVSSNAKVTSREFRDDSRCMRKHARRGTASALPRN